VLRTIGKRVSDQSIEQNIAAELQLLDDVKPLAAVVDFRPTMYISARVRRVPLIALVGGCWLYQYAATPYRAFRTYPHYPLVRRLLGVRGADACLPALQRLAMRYKTQPFARACRRHGIAPKHTPWELLVGDYNLILDSDLLSPTKDLPAHVKKVGPIFWSPTLPLPAWVATLDRSRPVVYVTMGSTAHPALFRRLLSIFQEMAVTVVMTTGGQITLEAEAIPANVRVETYLPGEQIMALADVVIHHGGAGTVYQTIAAGKPSIAVATHFEQEMIAARLDEQGAGIFLTMQDVMAKPENLAAALQRLLHHPQPYVENLRRLQQDLTRYDAVQAAADHIEAFLATSQTSCRPDGTAL
jgi:UDP:flavonoid glycosyltransferase YjiC (YdhE family)